MLPEAEVPRQIFSVTSGLASEETSAEPAKLGVALPMKRGSSWSVTLGAGLATSKLTGELAPG